MEHLSVLKEDVQKYLALNPGMIVVDATLGLGGHSKDILELIGESGKLIAFEQDERNLIEAKQRLKKYKNQTIYIHDNFRNLKTRITDIDINSVDAFLFDLGLSSPHVDEGSRGFSFLKEGPLDMRFDQRQKLKASDVINSYPEKDLYRIFREYGEEKMAYKLARNIEERRIEKPFLTTVDLADFVEKVYPKKYVSKKSKSHPATKIFQAIRMEVNEEVQVLREALDQAFELLTPGGRIVVISYHSIEDRLVKKFFRNLERPRPTPEESLYQTYGNPLVEKITKKPVTPDEQEISENPRSRSAKLRAYKKIKSK